MKNRLQWLRSFVLLAILALAYPILSHGVDMFGWFKKRKSF